MCDALTPGRGGPDRTRLANDDPTNLSFARVRARDQPICRSAATQQASDIPSASSAAL